MSMPIDKIVSALKAGNRGALARAITLVESGVNGADEIMKCVGGTNLARTIGFTGPPGSGKSTLINAFVKVLRASGEKVAVLAVDPSSPVSGGAILGDRTRMIDHTDDDSVFFRSISARGHLGGLCLSVQDVVDVLAAVGWDLIILETVGAGQSEVEIAEIADVKIVVSAPGHGDAVQVIKAGILEIASILVVNKCDKEGADETASDLGQRVSLQKRGTIAVPVIKTTATKHEGIQDLLVECLKQLDATSDVQRLDRKRQHVQKVISEKLFRRILNMLHNETSSLSEEFWDEVLFRRKTIKEAEQLLLEEALRLCTG